MIRLHLRENQSQTESIKAMVKNPSSRKPPDGELLDRVRQKLLRGQYFPWGSVRDAIEKLWDKRPERSDDERRPVILLDLTKMILDGGSRVVDCGQDGDCWSLLIQGSDLSGNQIQVSVRLAMEGDDDLLEIASFQPLF